MLLVRFVFLVLTGWPLLASAQLDLPTLGPKVQPAWIQDRTPLASREITGVIAVLEKICTYPPADIRSMHHNPSSSTGMVWTAKMLSDIRASGFSSATDWARSNFRVLRAFYLCQNPDAKQQLLDARKQLANLPVAERTHVEAMLNQTAAILDVPDRDLRTLQPHQARLEELLARLEEVAPVD